jgi:hypothetical protein
LAIAAFVGRHQRPLKMYSELEGTIKKMEVSKAGIAIASTILECFDKVQIDFNKCVSFG